MTTRLVEIDYGTDLYSKELELRDDMLRKPIGLQHSEADLVAEKAYRHFGILHEGGLVACLMVVPHEGGDLQIRQMAVREAFQGRGYGRDLMKGVEPLLYEAGARQIFLNARGTAIGFYSKLGYLEMGKPFIEVGIPHVRMEKALAAPK